MPQFHDSYDPDDGIHIVHAWTYADAAARTSHTPTSGLTTGLTPADVGKIGRQLDTNGFHVLLDDSPITWGADISGAGAALVIEDEGSALGSFDTINFTGAGVVATDAGGGVADITVAGGGTTTRTVTTTAIDLVLITADLGILVLLTSGANATLPVPATVGAGWWVDIKEAGNSSLFDIVPSGAENIDGSAGVAGLHKYEARTLVTDGTDWWSI